MQPLRQYSVQSRVGTGLVLCSGDPFCSPSGHLREPGPALEGQTFTCRLGECKANHALKEAC
jgi:hypothetical protein